MALSLLGIGAVAYAGFRLLTTSNRAANLAPPPSTFSASSSSSSASTVSLSERTRILTNSLSAPFTAGYWISCPGTWGRGGGVETTSSRINGLLMPGRTSLELGSVDPHWPFVQTFAEDDRGNLVRLQVGQVQDSDDRAAQEQQKTMNVQALIKLLNEYGAEVKIDQYGAIWGSALKIAKAIALIEFNEQPANPSATLLSSSSAALAATLLSPSSATPTAEQIVIDKIIADINAMNSKEHAAQKLFAAHELLFSIEQSLKTVTDEPAVTKLCTILVGVADWQIELIEMIAESLKGEATKVTTDVLKKTFAQAVKSHSLAVAKGAISKFTEDVIAAKFQALDSLRIQEREIEKEIAKIQASINSLPDWKSKLLKVDAELLKLELRFAQCKSEISKKLIRDVLVYLADWQIKGIQDQLESQEVSKDDLRLLNDCFIRAKNCRARFLTEGAITTFSSDDIEEISQTLERLDIYNRNADLATSSSSTISAAPEALPFSIEDAVSRYGYYDQLRAPDTSALTSFYGALADLNRRIDD